MKLPNDHFGRVEATDEPDFYESCDLPEADQRKEEVDVEQMLPKEIEQISLSVSDAHKRFENCKVDSKNADFSDDISVAGKVGYAVESSEYLSGAMDQESITQRFQRLQLEVRQLMNDAEAVGAQMKQADQSEPLSASELKQMASALSKQLSALQIEDMFGPNATVDLSGQEAILQKRIVEQINAFKPHEKPTKGAHQDHITYDLYMKPSLKGEPQNQKFLELDRRLERLEALLGQPDPTRLSSMTADTMGHGLLEAAQRLAARSSLLQPGHLDQIESRLVNLQTKLQSITEKRETIADADSQHKIAELYELVKKWDSLTTDLPQIVQRLQDLQTLHEQASEFSSSLASMELEQKRIDQNLDNYGKLLNQVQESVTETMKTFKDNIVVLDEKMKKAPK
ncbi:unnamed protein product [Schistocephalus solidus]|uniref:Dynactin subunit 2-B n=1 Tax=Schistocephalus solidus TaxID=70667 RepID=A0A183SWC1_SCHSO|nr:unnamed protein product [Schistocephalus solidus]